MSDLEHRYMRIAGLVFGQPLMATVEAAETVGAYLRARMDGVETRASRFIGAEQFDPESGKWKGYRAEGSVGIVNVQGELVNRGAWMGASSGLTSYEGLLQQVRQAAADPAIKTLLLDINSPGGEALGAVDAARSLKMAAGSLRIVAMANPLAASAAYALASVADEIVVNEAGMVGSIGIVSVHYDQSQALADRGVKATVIATGPKKTAGTSLLPLDDASAELLRKRADTLMAGFVKLVSDFRPQLSAEAIYALEGDILIGADAVAAGLADRVGTFESVLSDLTRAAGRTSQVKGTRMSENNGAPSAETAGFTQAQLDAAAAKAAADATAKANADADAKIKAERERMAGLDRLAAKVAGNAKGAEIIAAAKADGSTAEATALKLAEADAFSGAAVINALQGDNASAAGAAPAAPGAGASHAGTPDGWKAEYAASKDLQAEFGSEAAYVGYKQAMADGKVRFLNKGKAA